MWLSAFDEFFEINLTVSLLWPNPPELPGKAVDFLRRARNGKVPASARELGGRSDFNFVPAKVKVRRNKRSLSMKSSEDLKFRMVLV